MATKENGRDRRNIIPLFNQFASYDNWDSEMSRRYRSLYKHPDSATVDDVIASLLHYTNSTDAHKQAIDFPKRKLYLNVNGNAEAFGAAKSFAP